MSDTRQDAVAVHLRSKFAVQQPAPAADAERLYYIQNKGHCGDCLIFWRSSRNGYTTNLDEALKLPKSEAERLCKNRPGEDTMLPADVVDRIAHRHLNSEAYRAAMRAESEGRTDA